jgi:hypothetical protein
MPILAQQQISSKAPPSAPYFQMKAFQVSENADAFMVFHSFPTQRISAESSIVL